MTDKIELRKIFEEWYGNDVKWPKNTNYDDFETWFYKNVKEFKAEEFDLYLNDYMNEHGTSVIELAWYQTIGMGRGGWWKE